MEIIKNYLWLIFTIWNVSRPENDAQQSNGNFSGECFTSPWGISLNFIHKALVHDGGYSWGVSLKAFSREVPLLCCGIILRLETLSCNITSQVIYFNKYMVHTFLQVDDQKKASHEIIDLYKATLWHCTIQEWSESGLFRSKTWGYYPWVYGSNMIWTWQGCHIFLR